jgi:hypothetical protein
MSVLVISHSYVQDGPLVYFAARFIYAAAV